MQQGCSSSSSSLVQSSNLRRCSYSPSALGNSECFVNDVYGDAQHLNETLVLYCGICRAVSSSFVATSFSCRIFNKIPIVERTDHLNKTEIETMAVKTLGSEPLPHVLLWSCRVFRLIETAVWMNLQIILLVVSTLFEEGNLLGACGVAFQLFYYQLKIKIHLLQLALHRHFLLRHDYLALCQQTRFNIYRKLFFCYFICLSIIMMRHPWPTSRSPLSWHRFSYYRPAPCLNTTCMFKNQNDRTGGASVMKFSTAEFLSPYIEPQGQPVQSGECYHYVDHTDDIGMLAYSKNIYVFASVPLKDLFTQITVLQARVILKRHNISCGGRESMSAMQSLLDHHGGLCCTLNKSVFIKRLTNPKTPSERWRTHHSKKKSDMLTKSSEIQCDKQFNVEFPPAPLDKYLSDVIIEQACN